MKTKLPKITAAFLRKHGACAEGIEVFNSLWPNGVIPSLAAARKAALISSTLVVRTTAVKSVIDPTGIGTRSDVPSSLPFMALSTRLVARAAPVDVGTMLTAAARARRKSLCGPSTKFWSAV